MLLHPMLSPAMMSGNICEQRRDSDETAPR
jgi:hypothetical protein